MLELIEQGQLIEQDSSQDSQLGPFQAFHRDLTTPFKHALEQTVERLNRLMTQHVKDTTNVNT